MTALATYATFDADVPHDYVEGDDHTPDIPGGAGLLGLLITEAGAGFRARRCFRPR